MRKRKIPALIMAVALAGGCLARAALAADKVTFQLDWLPGGDKSPVYLGVQKGFFEEENLEVTISVGRGSTDAITRIATGPGRYRQRRYSRAHGGPGPG